VSLQVYRRKRKFDVTPEPRGRTVRGKGQQFVIQKHAARRLHYDLRLELDGVMKSWAVTRGPSLVPGEKRLAIEVEDHPVEYNSFEGTIPQGEYGGGTVLIWDRGQWQPEGDPHAGLRKGQLDFILDGEKLSGRWHLVRMHRRAGEKKQPWLLIKGKDEAARTARDPDILENEPRSVVSGRSIDEIAEGKGRKRVWHSNRSAPAAPLAGREEAQCENLAPNPARSPAARGRARSRTARRFLISCRRRWRRCARSRRVVLAGCTRSSSTAIACRRGSTAGRCACSRAKGSIGPTNFPTWRPRSRSFRRSRR
jgi:bifunctional non-homologous end joining protein LigD